MSQQLFERKRRAHHPIARHARFDTQPIEHVDEVFCRQIAGRARCIRATTETASRAVECSHSVLEGHEHVGQRRATRVMKVKRDVRQRHARKKHVEDLPYLPGMCDANRVTDRDFVRAERQQPFGQLCDTLRVDRPFERAAKARRQVSAGAQRRLVAASVT